MRDGRQGQIENIGISVILLRLVQNALFPSWLIPNASVTYLISGGWEKAEGGVLSLTGARTPKRDIVERLRDGTSRRNRPTGEE
jgi:hypothetical protein